MIIFNQEILRVCKQLHANSACRAAETDGVIFHSDLSIPEAGPESRPFLSSKLSVRLPTLLSAQLLPYFFGFIWHVNLLPNTLITAEEIDTVYKLQYHHTNHYQQVERPGAGRHVIRVSYFMDHTPLMFPSVSRNTPA